MITNNYCIIDLETTGTDVANDRIIEIAVVKIVQSNSPVPSLQVPKREVKSHRLNPVIPIPAEATKVHGITNQDVKDKPTFRQIAKALHAFIFGCDIVGYNSISFDVPMLYNEFQRAGENWEANKVNLIDACNIYKQKEPRTLADAVRFYCNKDHSNAHGALADAQATEEVLQSQFERYKDIKDLTVAELALYSNYGKKIVDVSGKFSLNESNDIVFNFGQHKGKLAKTEKKYLEWMIEKGNFNKDTKQIAQKILFT